MDKNTIEGSTLAQKFESLERITVDSALTKNRWNKRKTALELGLSRTRLDRIIERHRLKQKKSRKKV